MSADPQLWPIRVAWFQAATVACLLAASAVTASAAHGATSTIGRT